MKTLSLLIKPASSLCNMRCDYCCYADVSEHRSVKSYGVMSPETVSALLSRVKETKAEEITFAFQGGEPTVAGLPFFEDFAKKVKETLSGALVHCALQTNGLLLDDAFVAFLKRENVLVGLSLDGYREIHDFLRHDCDKRGTFQRVMAAYDRLIKADVDTNILTVVTGPLSKCATKLWRFYQKNKMDFVQLIPCLEALDEDCRQKWTLTPRQYAAFLKELFPLWAESLEKGDYTSIRLFDNLIRQSAGRACEMCGMNGSCSPQFVVEADGSVYPCDFYVLDELCCGNIRDNSFDEILEHPNMKRFLTPLLPKTCADCRFGGFCHGGCKRYRSLYLKEEGYCPYADFITTASRDIAKARYFVFGI